jgi:hypothetical protein
MFPQFRSFLKKIFASTKDVTVSLLLGLSIAVSIYLGLLQRHFFSYRYLFFAFLILICGTVLIAWINQRFIFPTFEKYSKPIKHFIIIISIIISIVLLFNVKDQPLYYILPDSELEIRFSVPDLPDENNGVHLLWIETGQGYVHYSRMNIEGQWERVGDHLLFHEGSDAYITWSGKVGQVAEVVFRHTDFDQPLEIIWNGVSQSVNLNQSRVPNIYIQTPIDVPVIDFSPFIFSFLISVGYGLFAFFTIFGNQHIFIQKRRSPFGWILFMLPMLVAWGFSLLIFWPGIMSTDAMTQWEMGVTGQYNDWQSGFHALILAGLMRIWYEPAFITIIQIFLFALASAWGLKILEDHGVNRGYLWGISLLFAVLPVNMLLSITLWKDIAYAIAFLWLSGIVLKIALSHGDWLKKPGNWIVLVLAAFLVSIFRQNGAAVSLLTLLALPFIYRYYWKPLTASLVITIFLFFLTKGPLYTGINLDRENTGQTNLIYLHHIAAHLDAGTEIDQTERDYLNSFQPLEDWDYWCCYVRTISYNKKFNRSDFLANTTQNRKLAIDLFLKDPWVDISHATCAAELTWKFENNQCYMKSSHGINTWRLGNVDWIVRNDLGLEDDSKLPQLVDPAVQFLRRFGFMDDKLVFYLRPAFWLYIGVLGVSVAVIRRKDLTLLSSLIPILSQTLILFLVSFAPAYRYHFGTVLAGILLMGLVFLPPDEKPVSS